MADVAFRTAELSEPAFEVDGLRQVTVDSPALDRRADVTVYASPGVDDGPAPLVVLLHGVFGSHWAWALKGGAHRTLSRLVEAGKVRPMVLAMPSDGLWGGGSGYVARKGEDSEAWIVEEVAAATRLAVPGAGADGAGVCIAGLSMGGYGAVRLGFRHPEVYTAAAGMSSITELAQMKWFVEEPLDDFAAAAGDQPNVIDAVLACPAEHRLPLRLDCGRDDFLLKANQGLHEQLTDARVDHEYEEFDGGHEWPYWAGHLDSVLEFFERSLARS